MSLFMVVVMLIFVVSLNVTMLSVEAPFMNLSLPPGFLNISLKPKKYFY